MKKLLLMLFCLFVLSSSSYALTFPLAINDCIVRGNTVELTGWFQQSRSYGIHRALDIPAMQNKPVRAVEMGEIEIGQEYPKYDSELKQWRSGYGNYIILKIYEKKKTIFGEVKVLKRTYLYGHLEKVGRFRDGDTVSEGDTIGYVGSTGIVNEHGVRRLAFHLHFEARDAQGIKMNMTKYFGDVVKAYFGSKDPYAFTLVNGGSLNN